MSSASPGVASPPAAGPPKTSLADRIGMIAGGQIVTAIIGLAQGVLLVRLVPKADYGALSFVTTLLATARDLLQLYLPESILYFAPPLSTAQLKGLVRQTMLLLLGLGGLVLLGFAAAALRPSIFLDGREGLGTLLLLAGLINLLGFPASVFGPVFVATDNHRKTAGIALVTTVIGAAGALLPAALGWSVVWIMASQIVTTGLRFALSYAAYARIFPRAEAAPFPGGARAQLAYALPLAATRLAGLINQKLDKVVVGLFFSAGLFAEFSIGSQELPLVGILPYTVASTMLPQLVERYSAGGRSEEGARSAVELWHAGTRKTSLVILPIAAFQLIAAESLMRVLYGDAYAGAAVPFRIYGALLPLRVTAFGIMLMAFGLTRAVLRIQIAGVVFNVAASLVLLPTIGMVGAPLAAVLSQAAMIVLIVWRVEAIARVGLRGIFPWSHYLRTALAAILAGAPLVALALALPPLHPGIHLAAGAPLYVALYLVAARALGIFAPEDRAFVARWLRLEPLRRRSA